MQTPVGHKAQAHTDTSRAQGTGPYRNQWGTRHRPIQTPVGHKAQAHTDTSRAQGTGPYRHKTQVHTDNSVTQDKGPYRHKAQAHTGTRHRPIQTQGMTNAELKERTS